MDGKDGTDGLDGLKGEKGLDGKDGKSKSLQFCNHANKSLIFIRQELPEASACLVNIEFYLFISVTTYKSPVSNCDLIVFIDEGPRGPKGEKGLTGPQGKKGEK